MWEFRLNLSLISHGHSGKFFSQCSRAMTLPFHHAPANCRWLETIITWITSLLLVSALEFTIIPFIEQLRENESEDLLCFGFGKSYHWKPFLFRCNCHVDQIYARGFTEVKYQPGKIVTLQMAAPSDSISMQVPSARSQSLQTDTSVGYSWS